MYAAAWRHDCWYFLQRKADRPWCWLPNNTPRRGQRSGTVAQSGFPVKVSGEEMMVANLDYSWPHWFNKSFFSIQGFLFYQKTTRNSYLESDEGPARTSSNMDRFERCFSIFKLEMNPGTTCSGTGAKPLDKHDATPRSSSLTESQSDDHSPRTPGEVNENGLESRRRSWRAVRVDLVVSPISQFAFALLGWTGSKVSPDKSHMGIWPVSL